MSRIIFDIETAGKDFDSLDKGTQEYLLKWAESEEDIQLQRATDLLKTWKVFKELPKAA